MSTLAELSGMIVKVKVINRYHYVTFMRPEFYDGDVKLEAKSMELSLSPEDRTKLIELLGGQDRVV